jgi:hypothetical protein
LKDTRVEIFEEIDHWLSRSDSSVLWIHAPAGSGKTAIASELARRLEKDGNHRLGATFFCRSTDDRTQDPTLVFPTIAFQLANSRQPIMDSVVTTLRNEPHVGQQSVANQFARLIREPLAKMNRSHSQVIVVILDALDDCGDAQSREALLQCLKDEIKSSSLPSWFKLLITSRPTHDIRLALHDAHSLPIELSSESNKRDLHMYVEDRMLDLVDMFDGDLSPGWPGRERVSKIEELAQGLFQWVHHLHKFIEVGTDQEERLDLVLSTDFHGGPTERLYALYTATFGHICKDEPEDFFANYKLYMGRILAAKYPLTSSDFCSLFRGSKKGVLDGIVWRFGSVLYTDSKGAIRVVHQSLIDFLTVSELCTDPRLHIDLEVQNTAFAQSCLELLSQTLKFNTCELPNAYQLRSEIEELPLLLDTHVPEAVRYSCRFWAAHLYATPKEHNDVYLLAKHFFQERVFYWIEALTLLDNLESALISLRDVHKWVDLVKVG